MARSGNLGSWAGGGAPAQGAAGVPYGDSSGTAKAFVDGVCSATDDPIKQYQVPTLGGSTVRCDVSPRVWGRSSKKP